MTSRTRSSGAQWGSITGVMACLLGGCINDLSVGLSAVAQADASSVEVDDAGAPRLDAGEPPIDAAEPLIDAASGKSDAGRDAASDAAGDATSTDAGLIMCEPGQGLCTIVGLVPTSGVCEAGKVRTCAKEPGRGCDWHCL